MATNIAHAGKVVKAISSERVSKYLEEWCKRLHLEAWEIKLVCFPDEEVYSERGGRMAKAWCEGCRAEREAVVRIATLRPWREVQFSVIHELLHIFFTDLAGCSNMLFSNVGKEMTELVEEATMQAEHDVIFTLSDLLLEDPDGD